MPKFRDHSLIPAEAVRLAALGLLSAGPRPYGELAVEVRHFASRMLGPSLDILCTSIELRRTIRLSVQFRSTQLAAERGSPSAHFWIKRCFKSRPASEWSCSLK